jgi:outer membrane lipoprotein SlyB
MIPRRSHVAVLAAALTFSAYADVGAGPPDERRQGRIEQVSDVQVNSGAELGLGAVIGGIAGGVLGSLIGSGTGRDVAIAVGMLAGVAAADYAHERYEAPRPAQQIVVRLPSGVLVAVTQQPPNPALHVGQPVYVEGSGAGAFVIPR